MRGFLTLEPDAATRAELTAAQNRLRDALARQGVHFPDRLGVPLLSWPFGRPDELAEAAEIVGFMPAPAMTMGGVVGHPNGDRPAEVGVEIFGAEALQAELFAALREALDPDPPKAAFVRLARVSPPSRKVGAALRGANLSGLLGDPYGAGSYALWNQTPQGFEVYRTMRVSHGGP